MNTKIWLEELSFGSNFGNLRAIGSNRFWCYFLVHTFKIKKVWIDFIKRFPSKVVKNFIRLYLRKPSCVRVEILAVSIPSTHLSNKKTALDYRSWVLVYITFAHGRTDGRTDRQIFFEKVFLSLPISIIFQISPKFRPKLVYLFFPVEMGMKRIYLYVFMVGLDYYFFT